MDGLCWSLVQGNLNHISQKSSNYEKELTRKKGPSWTLPNQLYTKIKEPIGLHINCASRLGKKAKGDFDCWTVD